MTSANSWPPGLLALADAADLDAAARIAIGRVGNTIQRVRLRDGRWGVLKRGGGALGGENARSEVLAEAERLAWLVDRAGAPTLLWAGVIGDQEVSMATHLSGRPAHEFTGDPRKAITLAASVLRAIHALPIEGCPFGDRSDSTDVVIHGDYALPNVIVDRDAVGIVDWSLMRIGDPREDIDDAERSIRRNFGERWEGLFSETYTAAAPI